MLLFAYLLRYGLPLGEDVLVLSFVAILRSTIHISLLICWCVSLYRRLVNNQIRRIIMGTGVLMAVWLLAKTVKYEFLVQTTDALGRYMWYSYYIPMIFIPLFGVFIIDHMGKPEGYSSPRYMRYLYIPAAVMLLTVFTNDAHQLVFRFYDGFAGYDKSYTYGITYFIIMAWYILLSLYFPVMLVKKCRAPGSTGVQKLPIIIILFSIAFWVAYTMRLISADLTVVDCIIIASLLESAIQTGMIPSNSNYQEIFNGTTLPIQVVDADYQPHYVSAGALPYPRRICAGVLTVR